MGAVGAGSKVGGSRRVRVATGAALAAAAAVGIGLVAVRSFPPDPERLWAEAQAEFEARRFDRADDALERLAAAREPTPLDHLLRAQVAIGLERPDEAIAELEAIPDDHRSAPQARVQAGQIELRRQRARAAEEAFLRALALDPDLVKARRELIYIYGMQLRRAALSEQFRALGAIGPLSFDEAFLWCLTRGSVWEPGEQAETLRSYIEADPTDRQSRLALAESLRRMVRFDEADEVLAPLPEDDADARALRARIALDRNDEAEVEALLAGGPDDHPELARLRARRAQARGDQAGAERHYAMALAAEPDDRDTLFGLGQALRALGRADEAAPYLERAKRLDEVSTLVQRAAPGSQTRDAPGLVKALGAACEAAGRTPEALAWYGLALARDPLDAEAQRAMYRLKQAGASRRTD